MGDFPFDDDLAQFVARYDRHGSLQAIHLPIDADFKSVLREARRNTTPPEGGSYRVFDAPGDQGERVGPMGE